MERKQSGLGTIVGVVAGNRSSSPSLKLHGSLIFAVLPFSLACVTPSAQVRVTYSKTDSLQVRVWGLRGAEGLPASRPVWGSPDGLPVLPWFLPLSLLPTLPAPSWGRLDSGLG